MLKVEHLVFFISHLVGSIGPTMENFCLFSTIQGGEWRGALFENNVNSAHLYWAELGNNSCINLIPDFY